MSTRLQLEKILTDAAKAITNGVVAQIVGPYDNTDKTRPRLEVDWASEGIANERMLQNSNSAYYYSDHRGTWSLRVVTNHTDANHHTYVGQVRELFTARPNIVQGNTNTNIEVLDVREAGSEITRTPEEDELATRLDFEVWFAVRPW